nr:MAG TPA: hypothetical protein [Caudoviricetes sp.]
MEMWPSPQAGSHITGAKGSSSSNSSTAFGSVA